MLTRRRGSGRKKTPSHPNCHKTTPSTSINFSKEAPLCSSAAVVEVYEGQSDAPRARFTIPTDIVLDVGGKDAAIWHLFDLVGGSIVHVNKVMVAIDKTGYEEH